jgi:thioredoxin-like negative regulator of GroEL
MLGNLERVNESLIKESDGSPTYGVYKYDVESDMDFSRELGIRSVPTIKIFKKGTEVFSQSGVMQPAQVLSLLN